MSVEQPGPDSRPEAAVGAFSLSAKDGRTELELIGPLGQKLAHASAGPREASLTLSDGRVLRADDAETLTERSFGWRLPMSRLADWLNGIAAGQSQRDDQGRLVSGVDSNWRLTVTEWTGRLPRRLELQWPVDPSVAPADARRIRLRLVIDV